MKERYRAIIIKNDSILLMKRQKNGKTFYVFPGGMREENETEKQCVKRELEEEFGIMIEPKQMIYEISQNGEKQGFFVCEWISGDIHKTDAEEYSTNDISLYGTYEPVKLSLEKAFNFEKISKNTEINEKNQEFFKKSTQNFAEVTILPNEVFLQLQQDLITFGIKLKRPLIKFKCADY